MSLGSTSFVTTNGEIKHDMMVSISPIDATTQSPINWSVVGTNTHSITFEGNKMITNTEIEDTVTIRAEVPDGLGTGSNYSKQFTITFTK